MRDVGFRGEGDATLPLLSKKQFTEYLDQLVFLIRLMALRAWSPTRLSGSFEADSRAGKAEIAGGPILERESTAAKRTAGSMSRRAAIKAGRTSGWAVPTLPRISTACLRSFTCRDLARSIQWRTGLPENINSEGAGTAGAQARPDIQRSMNKVAKMLFTQVCRLIFQNAGIIAIASSAHSPEGLTIDCGQ